MNLNKPIAWVNSLLYLFALSFIMLNIISIFYDKALGLIFVFVLFNFSMFFFLRRSFQFQLKTLVYFYIIGIIGSFLMKFLNPIYMTFFMSVVFYLVFLNTVVKTKIKLEKKELKKFFILDASIFIFFIMIVFYIYKYLFITQV